MATQSDILPDGARLFGARTPVGVAAPGRDSMILVCQDGAVYRLATPLRDVYAWEELPPVPGSAREHERREQVAAEYARELDACFGAPTSPALGMERVA